MYPQKRRNERLINKGYIHILVITLRVLAIAPIGLARPLFLYNLMMAKLTQTQVKKQIVKWKGSANHGYINIPKGVQGDTIIVTNLYKKKEIPIIALTKSHVLVMPKKWVGDRVEVDIYKGG